MKVHRWPKALLWSAGLALALAAPGQAARVTRAQARGATIVFSGAKLCEVTVSSFVLGSPSRLIFDLQGAALAARLPAEVPVRFPGVTKARLRQFQSDPEIARLVLELAPGVKAPRWRALPSKRGEELLLTLAPAGPVTLPAPTVEQQRKAWVVRLPGMGYLEHNVGALDHPARIFLDFTNAEVPASSGRNFASGPIRGVRVGQQPPAGEIPVARVAIELRAAQAFAEEIEEGDLVLSFHPRPEAATYDVPEDPGTYDVPADPGTYDVPAPPERARRAAVTGPSLRGKHIVVDPGHGGGDSGAQWSDEEGTLFESEVTWGIASRLARKLEAAGAKVTLTRGESGPRSKPGQRARLANRLSADAYVSIHCNSCLATDDTATGTSVYFGHEHSRALAEAVQEELVKEWELADRGTVQDSYLTVINATTGPAILIETAFLDHKDDRALLTDPEAQERGARAIVRGLEHFFATTGGKP